MLKCTFLIHRPDDRGNVRVRILGQQAGAGHDHARSAVAALHGARVEECLLERVQLAVFCSRPSMVVIGRWATAANRVRQERTGWPSTRTVQAPQRPSPQPYLCPSGRGHPARRSAGFGRHPRRRGACSVDPQLGDPRHRSVSRWLECAGFRRAPARAWCRWRRRTCRPPCPSAGASRRRGSAAGSCAPCRTPGAGRA